MRKDALATELHFILDANRVPREAFLLERILYLEDDGTEFAPPRTARRQITMDDAKAMFDHAAADAVQEAKALALQIAGERNHAQAALREALGALRAEHDTLVAQKDDALAAKDAEIAELKRGAKKQ